MFQYTEDKVESLVKVHGNAVLRMAHSYMHNLNDAEDVLQETFLKLIESKPVFDSAEHERAWLLRVAINICKNKLKSSWNRYAELAENCGEGVHQGEDLELRQVVDALPAKYREIIHLHYYEGYKTGEIAHLLGKRESTVRSLLRRGREKLKEQLKGVYDYA